jgi:D-lactate dehydrogenase (cytochrome)
MGKLRLLCSLAECVLAAQADAVQHGVFAPMVGHVGDGNFHMMMIIDPHSQ